MDRLDSRVFRPYARWIIAHRVLVVTGILLVTGVLVSRLGSLEVDSNPDLWAPQNHAYVEATNLLEDLFGGRNLTVIGILPKKGDIYQPTVLEKISTDAISPPRLSQSERLNALSNAFRPELPSEGRGRD